MQTDVEADLSDTSPDQVHRLPFDYDGYVRAFNEARHDEAVNIYFAQDAVAYLNDGIHRGREAIKARLAVVDSGVREKLRPQLTLTDGHSVFADILVEFTATRESPDYWLGPMKSGDIRTTRIFALYEVDGGKIVSITTMAKPG